MTLDDLERQNRGFYGFFGDFGLRHKSVIHKDTPRYYHYVHFGMIVIKVCILSQIPTNLTQTATDFHCTISLYCEHNNLLFSTFLMHSIW